MGFKHLRFIEDTGLAVHLPCGGWGHIGCESEAAFADSVSHTFSPLILLFGGGSADIEEHNNPSKVEMTPLWRLFDRS